MKDIKEICEKFNITDYTINPDGSIDVEGDVDLEDLDLKELPLKFRNVRGNFYCRENQLTSLKGCPQGVGGEFSCSGNQLTSLEGCPQSVSGDFYCSRNQLTSLEGSPQSVGGDFYCRDNQLTSLEGCPQSVGGDFYCRDNHQLTSLEGCPKKINGNFFCDNYLFEEMVILTKPKKQDIEIHRRGMIKKYKRYVSDDYFIPIIRNEKLRKLLND